MITNVYPIEQSLVHRRERSGPSFLDTIIGRSGSLRAALSQVEIVAPTNARVLISGETGTGKELIARAIHELSPRHNRNVVKVNCAAIPAGLLESELFGHERGAFTGALMQKKGRFELADGGTLFLDEIGDIPLELQPKLLRVVQEQEFERLGSAHTIHVNVRIIAATHRNLPAMIREGQFREDLFYRLNVFPIAIPALRERREDIPLLVNHFVSKLSRQMGRQIKSIPPRTMELLTNHPWRGNVRELANFIERAVVLSQGEELKVPAEELTAWHSPEITSISTFQQAERNVIMDALKASSGRIAGKGGAAERLGLKRTTLQNKMHKLGITRECARLNDLPSGLQSELVTPLDRIGPILPSGGVSLSEIEKEVFRQALKRNRWNQRYLGVRRD
jgi:formate hydrogenlyase transcriptional activator